MGINTSGLCDTTHPTPKAAIDCCAEEFDDDDDEEDGGPLIPVPDGGVPDPEAFRIPTIGELDAMRTARNLSQRELSRRAGVEEGRFHHILRRGVDPQTSTLRAFLEALKEATPRTDDEIERRGPKPEPSTVAKSWDDIDPEDLVTDGGSKYVVETGEGFESVRKVSTASTDINLGTCEAVEWPLGTTIYFVPDPEGVRATTEHATETLGKPPHVYRSTTGGPAVTIPVPAIEHLGVVPGGDVRIYDGGDNDLLVVSKADDPRVLTDGGVRRAYADATDYPHAGVGEQDSACVHGEDGCPGPDAPGPITACCWSCFLASDGGDSHE